jgi:hypothetical protein
VTSSEESSGDSEPSHQHKATQKSPTDIDILADQLEQVFIQTNQKLANITMAQANMQQPMAPPQQPDPQPQPAGPNNLVTILTDWQIKDQNHNTIRYQDTELDKVAQQVGRCDCTSPTQIRTWLDVFELAFPNVLNLALPNPALSLLYKCISGELYKEIESYLVSQPNRLAVTWQQFKAHIQKTFLSSNETQKLQAELEVLDKDMQRPTYNGTGTLNAWPELLMEPPMPSLNT